MSSALQNLTGDGDAARSRFVLSGDSMRIGFDAGNGHTPDPSHTTRVTPMLLREIQALGRDGIASEGDLLRFYVTCGGKLKRPGRVRLARFESNTSAQCARDATVTALSNVHRQA